MMSSLAPKYLAKWIFRHFIVCCFLYASIGSAYAIPPPETIALLGGSLAYSGILIIGMVGIFCKYFWIKTKLYMLWRLYFSQICFIIMALLLWVNFSDNFLGINNNPVTLSTIKDWQRIKTKFVFIDLSDKVTYEKIHIAGSISFPSGTGLNDFLKNNTDEIIILYCNKGFKSGILTWLDTDSSLLKKTREQNRLFYFPGGITNLMTLGKQSPIPVVVNLPWGYADYLIKDNPFKLLPFNLEKSELSPQELSAYQQIVAKGDTPILSTPAGTNKEMVRGSLPMPDLATKDKLAWQVENQLKIAHTYFTSIEKQKPYPLNSFLLVLGILFGVQLFIRRQELLQSMSAKTPMWYQWSDVFISLIMIVPVIYFTISLSIPVDINLYNLTSELPLNVAYFFPSYILFALILAVHLLYPKSKRLNFLHFKISAVFAPSKQTIDAPEWSGKNLIIYGVSLYLFYYWVTPIASIFLLVPLLVDLLLYVMICQWKNTEQQALSLLDKCHYIRSSKGKPFIYIDTRSESSLASIKLRVKDQISEIGLFSAKLLKGANVSSARLKSCANLARNVLLLFHQDVELILDEHQHVITIKLYHNHLASTVINKYILLKHWQLLSRKTDELCFSSLPLQEVFANPSPLMLDILKNRWHKKGGCFKALHKLGLASKYKNNAQEQFIAFSKQIYIDKCFEQAIFSSNKILTWIRQKIVSLRFNLATESIVQDYHMLIVPRTQIRLMKLSEYLSSPLSDKQLLRIVNRAISVLCKESALWQCYSSLVHQDAFHQLQVKATKSSCELSTLLPVPVISSLPTYYELSTNLGLFPEKQNFCTELQAAFLKTENVRTHLREFQLREWQLISLLLEKLAQQLNLPLSLSFLTIDNLRSLPHNRSKLIELLENQQQIWELQNQYQFPASFSLEDMEKLPLNANEAQLNRATPIMGPLRVSGNQERIMGTARLFHEHVKLETLAKHSILIANNLSPEQIVKAQHIKGIILQKGGYLSHSAIIAREKNIPMIAQFQTAKIKNKDKLIIHAINQVEIFSDHIIDWDFLEAMDENTSLENKAKRLAIMSRSGFNIPESIILKHKAVRKIYKLVSSLSVDSEWEKYLQELTHLFALLSMNKSPLIVRSATNLEDSNLYSYAGIFYSQPNINSTDDLIAAICASWEKLQENSSLIKQYSGESQITLDLIIQIYIKGQVGGVLFTQSEIPGQMRIEIATEGIEGVTEGNASIASFNIDDKGQTYQVVGEKNILSAMKYKELYQLGLELELLFGNAQDIEWIIADQQLYVIQSRDISNKGQLNAIAKIE